MTMQNPVWHTFEGQFRGSLGKLDGENGDVWIQSDYKSSFMKVGTKRGAWDVSKGDTLQHGTMPSLSGILLSLIAAETPSVLRDVCKPEEDSPKVIEEDRKAWQLLRDEILIVGRLCHVLPSAPVRSQPRRTYDPTASASDPEGGYVPMLFAELSL